jgi:hypothetical protein
LPTLSELIEACGDKFESLYKVYGITASAKSSGKAGGYEAIAVQVNEFSEHQWEWGKTPEEAVAKLWLSLNK